MEVRDGGLTLHLSLITLGLTQTLAAFGRTSHLRILILCGDVQYVPKYCFSPKLQETLYLFLYRIRK